MRSRMKKAACYIITPLFLIVAIIITYQAIKTSSQTAEIPSPFLFNKLKEATLVTILETPVGTKDGELSYGAISDNGIATAGPNDFAVAGNGDLYILDNYYNNGNGRISIFSNGKFINNIYITNFVAYGVNMTFMKDSIYLFDHNYDQGNAYIVKMSLTGELLEKYVYNGNETSFDIQRLVVIDDKVVAISQQACYELDETSKEVIKSDIMVGDTYLNQYQRKITWGGINWTIPIEQPDIIPVPIGKNSNGDLFTVFGGNKYICRCKANGEPVSIIHLDELLKDTVYIQNNLYVAADGTLYIMAGSLDAVRVYQVQ
ncbi:MAG: hypothetical protein VB070_13780 [Clostridiaceae bacterium]|nr:hypothetical protein [Clostridiaceae bacterium]